MVHFEDDRRSPSHRRANVGHYGQQRYNQHVNDYYGYTSPIHARRDRQQGIGSAYPSATAASVNATHRRRGRHDQAIEPLHAATPYQDGEQQSFSPIASGEPHSQDRGIPAWCVPVVLTKLHW
jgi:hypothetical protein